MVYNNRMAGVDRPSDSRRSRSGHTDSGHSGDSPCDIQMMRSENHILIMSIFAGILMVIVAISAMLITDSINMDRLFSYKTKHRYIPALPVSDILYEYEPNEIRMTKTPRIIEEPELQAPTEYYESEYGYHEPEYDYSYEETDGFYSSDYLRSAGVVNDGGTKYTWYSQNVLPGGGLDIEGRHVEDGYVVDGNGRIVVASSDIPYGTEIDLPFGSGKGIVLDTGYLEPGQIDIYTDF